MALSRGEGHFIPALAGPTHENSDDRLPAGALAVGLAAVVIGPVLVAWSARARRVLPVLLAALTTGGAVALWNPWENDWIFIAVRPEVTRGAAMPIPSAKDSTRRPGSRRFRRARTSRAWRRRLSIRTAWLPMSKDPGPVVIIVLEGCADVTVADGAPARLGYHEGTLVQAGESYRVLNPSGTALRLLRFALTPRTSSP